MNLSKKVKRVGPMVARAFHGPPLEDQVLRHLNDDPWDNRIENLQWGTVAENAQDALRNGKNYMCNQECCKRGHPLREPNLVRGMKHRRCRACHESQRIWALHPELDPDQIADDYYARIHDEPESGLLSTVRPPRRNRKECSRGHLLVGANVREARNGQRACVACETARDLKRATPTASLSELRAQCYQELMGHEAA